MSGQTFLFVLFLELVVGFAMLRALWRAWARSRVRRASVAATPAVAGLEAAIAAFHTRFPVPTVVRLPMDPEDYPEAKPHKQSLPRPRSREALTMSREFFLRFGWKPSVELLTDFQRELTER